MFDYAPKIQSLVAHAEDERLSDEARASYRAKAEELMIKYRIAEEELIAGDEAASSPITYDIVICHNATGSPLQSWYGLVFSIIARHTGVRFLPSWTRGEDGTYRIVATVVGYEGDVRYTEFLWTAAYLMFSTRVDPVWDTNRSEDENIYLLRNAGIERRKIADAAWGNGSTAAARSKVQRIYLRECSLRDESPMASGLSHNTTVYREAYARSFRDTLSRRLQDARDAADSVGGSIVLHGRSDRVDEAFYTRYPHLRPEPRPTSVPMECEDCKKTKHASGECRNHRPRAWTKADEARYQRMHESPSAHAGSASGQVAAEGVVIERGTPRAARLDPSGRAIEN